MSALEETKRDLGERVSLSIGVTKTVDYNSVRVDIGLERGLREGETIGQAYASIRNGLEKELDRTYEELTGAADGN